MTPLRHNPADGTDAALLPCPRCASSDLYDDFELVPADDGVWQPMAHPATCRTTISSSGRESDTDDHRAVNPRKGRRLRAGKRVPQAAHIQLSGGGATLPRRRAK